MFDWLFEGRLLTYAVPAAVGIGLLLAWRAKPRRGLLVAACAAFALLPLLFLLDRTVETDREEIRRKVEELAAGVKAKDLDRTFAGLSERFQSPGGKNKAQFRAFAEGLMRSGQVTDLVIWDHAFPDTLARDKPVLVSFHFKVVGGPGPIDGAQFRCEATYEYSEPLGWRLLRYRLLDPLTGNTEFPAP